MRQALSLLRKLPEFYFFRSIGLGRFDNLHFYINGAADGTFGALSLVSCVAFLLLYCCVVYIGENQDFYSSTIIDR